MKGSTSAMFPKGGDRSAAARVGDHLPFGTADAASGGELPCQGQARPPRLGRRGSASKFALLHSYSPPNAGLFFKTTANLSAGFFRREDLSNEDDT
jgi:hypothetical protein